MTADAFQEPTGAMIENGSAREAAEGSVSELFEKANDAVHGRNDGFRLAQTARDRISETKDGLADVGKLINDLNRAMQSLPACQQALFANNWAFRPIFSAICATRPVKFNGSRIRPAGMA